MEFDLELAKAETSENPVFYVQYAHARLVRGVARGDRSAASNLRMAKFRLLTYGSASWRCCGG